MSNPLLLKSDLPAFERIKAEHIVPAVESVLSQNRLRIAQRLESNEPPNWQNVAELTAELDEKLERVWSPVRHLIAVANSEALRKAYNACLPLISEYHTELGHKIELYNLWLKLNEQSKELCLDDAQCKVVQDTLREFHLSGVDLDEQKKKEFSDLQMRLSMLQTKFEENLLDATHGWSLTLEDEKKLNGMTKSGLALARQMAETQGEKGYRLTLDFPSYDALISYCNDRKLRETVYTAYATKASDLGPQGGHWDNTDILSEILLLRRRLAKLLGLSSFAEMSLMTKMAGTPEEVLGFLKDLATRSHRSAERELQELRTFASEELGIEEIESWDLAYVSQKLRENRYRFDEEKIKTYFPVERVLSGLFGLANDLFGITITKNPEKIETWHKDVKFYDVRDATGNLRAQFYVDLYARENKRGGAWMDECRGYHEQSEEPKHPIAYLTCNSSPPIGGKPGLFTHDEVVTLFHEFGHGLHHMLTRVPYAQISGIRGVEWDAVELPSQFMENWCWKDEILERISGHYETGEPLPESLRNALLETRDFQAGMQMLRQIEFSVIDMRLHMASELLDGEKIQELIDSIRKEIAVIIPPKFNRFQNSFSHIFGGGYAAGYYSYKWAEVLSADAFARFEEEGLFNRETGTSFLSNVLEMGGSKPALELFRNFRGREPRIDALLKQTGIAA